MKFKNLKLFLVEFATTKKNQNKKLVLRWKYGHKRETKSVKERLKEPYTIVSSSLLVNKEVFFENNTSKSIHTD